MIHGNGSDHDSGNSGSRHTRRLERTRASASPPRRRTPRLPLSHRLPSTVWPCAQGEQREDTGLLADWLLTAVVRIVTTYTEPGHRVLLLAPPSGSRRTASGSSAVGGGRGHGPYAGLHEAAWTVVRLGRGIQTYTAGPTDSPTDAGIAERSEPPVRASDSDRHLGDTSPDPGDTGRSDSRTPVEPTGRRAANPPDRFDLIITTVNPQAPRWVRTRDWDRLLTVHGTLAVITHSDRHAGRLTDPTGMLVRIVRAAGLTFRDHAALLWVPVRRGALDTGADSATDHHLVPASVVGAPQAPAQVHSDLLIFTRLPSPATATGDRETSDV